MESKENQRENVMSHHAQINERKYKGRVTSECGEAWSLGNDG